ncbi:MAG: C/D box methylation guide ribonucleoprotein complex aNOP56 subunit [Candidatus Heimdallarchaeota archaeon]|nr:C/D box methylation guide ribonucleoprotein complex aNOP56 subunit [Candidatus Heimdallarchaeota archaeon]
MTTRIIANISGFFVFDEGNKLLDLRLYAKNAEEIAEEIHNLSKYTLSEFLKDLLSNIEDIEIETNSSDVLNFIRVNGKKGDLLTKADYYSELVAQIPKILVQEGFIKNEEELDELTREVSIALSKKSIAYSSQRIDKNVVHAILSMDDIDKTTNLFTSRIREWYGVHFPETLKEVPNHVTLCKLITEIGSRDNFTEELLQNYGFSTEKGKKIVEVAKKSMGAHFEDKDLRPLQRLAQSTLDLYNERDRLESWIEREMGRIAPNMKAVVGSSIAARLIALAGGLMEIAMKPASTIQLLGAEKALFRALKTGAKPPKHGIIYQMPEIHSCPWWQRGNISRAIAGRLTIAARVDAFQGEFMGDQLKREVDQKIEEIREKYKEPPEGKKPPIDRSQQPQSSGPPRHGSSRQGSQRYGSSKQGQRKYPPKKGNYPKKKRRY